MVAFMKPAIEVPIPGHRWPNRIVAATGYHAPVIHSDRADMYLELDGIAMSRSVLDLFVRDWARGTIRLWVRPDREGDAQCPEVWLASERKNGAPWTQRTCWDLGLYGHDYVRSFGVAGDNETMAEYMGHFLLLRVDGEHPFHRDTRPGWVLFNHVAFREYGDVQRATLARSGDL